MAARRGAGGGAQQAAARERHRAKGRNDMWYAHNAGYYHLFFSGQALVSWQSPLTVLERSLGIRNQEQSSATTVPQLSVVADMTRG